MSPRLLLLIVALAAAVRTEAAPPERGTRSASRSRQFVIFCPDAALRGRVGGLVEEIKTDVLELLGEGVDRWKMPIVISLAPPTGRTRPPVLFQMIATPEGAKIEIDAEIGSDLAAVNLRKQVVRAVLLEMSYRGRPAILGGEASPGGAVVAGGWRDRDLPAARSGGGFGAVPAAGGDE